MREHVSRKRTGKSSASASKKEALLRKETAPSADMLSIRSRTILQVIAIFLIELIVLLPANMVYALQIIPSSPPHTSVGYNTATISWQTDVPSTGRVEYGAPGNLNQIVESAQLQTSHQAVLSGLESQKAYSYRIIAIDAAGAVATQDNFGANFQFTTAQAPDLSPPIISDVGVQSITSSTATISWKTNKPATTKVYYGTKAPLNLTDSAPGYVLSHAIIISIADQTSYSYIVSSCSSAQVCVNSTPATLVSGTQQQPFLNLTIPSHYNSRRMDISGSTVPNSMVDLHVGAQIVRSVRSDVQGAFSIAGITLVEGNSTLKIGVTDQIGAKIERNYSVIVDTKPPVLQMNPVPDSSTSTSLILNGTVDELVTLNFRVVNKKDQDPPARVTGVTAKSVFTNTVEIAWDKSDAADLQEYVIYRDGIRITATRTTSFRDAGAFVDSAKTYRYQVSAIDKSCNEGQKSDVLSVTTHSGGPQYNRTPSSFNLSCSIFKETQQLSISGDFAQAVNLGPGENFINVTATDRAGNVVRFDKKIIFDNQPPRILENNLAEITPSYFDDVYVKGKVDKQAVLRAYVNNETEPVNVTRTDSDGNFIMHIQLRREIVFSSDTGVEGERVSNIIQSADAWVNHVRIVAEGETGLTTEIKGDIIYAICGYGNWFNVYITEPTPSMLTPRLILEGIARVGFAVNLTSATIPLANSSFESRPRYQITRKPRIHFQTVSPEMRVHYDMDKVSIASQWNSDYTAGFITLNFKAYDPSINGAKNPRDGKNWTIYEKELNISKLHVSRCLLGSITGCVRVPLVMEVVVEEKVDEYFQSAWLDTTEEGYRVQSLTQRHCWLVEVPIDYRVPPSVIPNEFLSSSVNAIEKIIDGIDKVLEPLAKVQKYVFYACLFSWLFQFVIQFSESWNCEYSNALGAFTGQRFQKEVALTGQCDTVYPPSDENAQQKNELCRVCQASIESRQQFEKLSTWVCDRMFCPSAPTFQKYIRDNRNNKRQVDVKFSDSSGAIIKTGSDCAELNYEDYQTVQQQWEYYQNGGKSASAPSVAGGNAAGVAGSAQAAAAQQGDIDCSKLHERDARCCSTEYMNTWNSACVVMNELKESKCLAEQDANVGMGGDCNRVWNAIAGYCDPDGKPVPQLVNTYFRYSSRTSTGFPYLSTAPNYQVTGQQNPAYSNPAPNPGLATNTFTGQVVSALTGRVAFYGSSDERQTAFESVAGYAEPGKRGTTYACTGGHVFGFNEDHNVYYRIMSGADMKNANYRSSTGGSSNQQKQFVVHRGYIVERKDLSSIEIDNKDIPGFNAETMLDSPVNAYLVFRPVEDVTEFFEMPQDASQADTPTTISGQQLPQTQTNVRAGLKAKFAQDLMGCIDGGAGINPREIDDVYERIYRRIGIGDKDYIVDPTSSFLRSVQCVCLPGITSYLRLYRAILTAVKTCFNSILKTGEGSAGICRAVLSVYICDLIWDLLRCFSEKYSAGVDRSRSDSLGNLFGALTSAGNGVSNSIQNRYGGTTLYKSLFVEKKLVHAVCLWAFTGTWDLDVTGLIEGDGLQVPIKSQGLLYPCQRRFISFNPVTRPVPGLASFTYHFGVGLVAGADLRWNLELECSTTPECKSSEGFENGLCDCQQGTPQKTIIQGGYMKAGDVLSEQDQGDVFFTTTMPYRYNKARLWWEYKDNKDQTVRDDVTCDISAEGPAAPGICGFDIATLSYRCGLDTGSENWARIIGRPRSWGDPFRLGDQLGFDVEVSQRIPGDGCEGIENCQYQKYLVVSVVNQNGVPIFNNYNEPYPLVQNGREVASVVRGIPTVISRQDFSASSTVSTSTRCAIRGDGIGINPAGLSCGTTMKVFVEEATGNLAYVIGTYNEQPVVGAAPGSPGSSQGFVQTGQPAMCGDVDGRKQNYQCGIGNLITLRAPLQTIPKGASAVLVADVVSSTETTQSSLNCDPNVPVTWKASFTIYEANQLAEGGYGASQNQVAQYLGAPQQFQYQYNAICAERIQFGAGTAGAGSGGLAGTNRDLVPPQFKTFNIYEVGTGVLEPPTIENANAYRLRHGKNYMLEVGVEDTAGSAVGAQASGIQQVSLTVGGLGQQGIIPGQLRTDSSSASVKIYRFDLSQAIGGQISSSQNTFTLYVKAVDAANNAADHAPIQVTIIAP